MFLMMITIYIDEKMFFLHHQAVVATLRDADETATTAISDMSLSRDVARLSEMADISEGPEDDDNGKTLV